MKPNATKPDFLSTVPGILTAAIAANLLWGSAAPCIKLGYQYFAIAEGDTMSQILFAGVRFTLAGILTILIGSLLRGRLLLPKRGSGGMIFTLAMMQTVIQYTFFYIGLSHAPGFKGSIISPTSTFFALLIAALVFRQEKLTARKLLGCLIGFAGVIVVSMNGRQMSGVRLDGEGFLVLAAASYGCSSVLIKRFSAREDPVVLSGWQFLVGGLLMTLVAYAVRRKAARGFTQGLAADAVPGISLRCRVYPLVPAAAAAPGIAHHGFLFPEPGVRRRFVGAAAG